ncbi:MAG: YtxH domain-containing protein [Coriobacteriales bacterium]
MKKGFGLAGVLVGGVIGITLGVLYAPRAGEETRAMVSERIDEYWGQGKELYDRGVDHMQSTYADVSSKVQDRYSDVSDRFQATRDDVAGQVGAVRDRVKPRVAGANDELRNKIDEARARIASQISKNTEEAGDELRETAPSASASLDDDRYEHWNPAAEWANNDNSDD